MEKHAKEKSDGKFIHKYSLDVSNRELRNTDNWTAMEISGVPESYDPEFVGRVINKKK